jgi:hypothetical protein
MKQTSIRVDLPIKIVSEDVICDKCRSLSLHHDQRRMRVLPILSIRLFKKDLASVVFDLKCVGGLVRPELIVGDLC